MNLQSIFNAGPQWQTWAIPAAGLATCLLALFAGRIVHARWRAPGRKADEDQADGPVHDHDPFDSGSVSERRAVVRRKGNPIEVIIDLPEGSAGPERAWVIDRSMGGVCLSLLEEAAPGTQFRIKPRNAPPATPWVEIEVRSCKKDSTGYEAGCRFVRTPPWAVLLLFG